MTDHPMIFNAAEVLAVLDGRKTQHRVPLKGNYHLDCTGYASHHDGGHT